MYNMIVVIAGTAGTDKLEMKSLNYEVISLFNTHYQEYNYVQIGCFLCAV